MTIAERFSTQLKNDLIASIPKLRAFAVSLSGHSDRADDLVQETLTKALQNLDTFETGSNLLAWLFTILRNTYYSEFRKRQREVPDVDGKYTAALISKAEQEHHVEYLDFREALQKLPPDQREALILVGASGMSYEEAAEICKCAIGTVKSRVSRARRSLTELLEIAPKNTEGRHQSSR